MNISMNRRGAVGSAVTSLAGASLLIGLAGKATAAFAQPAADPSPADTSADVKYKVFILPDGLQGPEGKMHDAFVPSNFVVSAGVPTTIQFVNYDGGSHSVTVPSLGLDFDIAAGTRDAAKNRVPTITSVTLTVPEKGNYRWDCDETCDGGADHWAMGTGFAGDSQEGYMAGYIVAI